MRSFTPVLVVLLGSLCAPRSGNPPWHAAGSRLASISRFRRGTSLAGGLKNSGSPNEVHFATQASRPESKTINLKDDPLRMCQPIGEFRMMARDQTKIEFAPAKGLLVMLFEDVALGVMRIIYMNRGHIDHPEGGSDPTAEKGTWFGDSVGHWEGETLLIDTVGFNTRTWLNDAGAQHSDALHLTEHIRPILGGQYLKGI